jgi:hypothetical protein
MSYHSKGLKRNLKYKDKREDGYIFIRFRKEINKDGFHREEWQHPYHRSNIYRAKYDLKYKESEKGFFDILWQSIKNSSKKRGTINFIKDRDHLLELWNNHKKEYGPRCRYTGIELTTKRSTGEGWQKSRPTNISIDRINPDLPYEEGNIVFCTWEFNNRKSGVTPQDCKIILKVYEELHA